MRYICGKHKRYNAKVKFKSTSPVQTDEICRSNDNHLYNRI